jgi:uncharacterized protein with von Willebrand factor type A (vWA) domain
MAPYEITYPGGAIEYHNEEPGAVWIKRLTDTYEKLLWLNPVHKEHWEYTPSIRMINELVEGQMYPLTLHGLEEAMSFLSR